MKINAFEAAAKYVYPSLRRRLVEILYKKGLTQVQVAELLHITQSAVSRYIKMNRGALVEVEKFKDIDEELMELAERILKERPNEYYIHSELVKIALKMLGKGYVCSFHSKVDPEVDPARCNICLDIFG
ncbi:helix-turn-helix domain-containing protein [Thermococcus sp. MV5]|uniref:transcriptional regulator n=1 Tax=Thermococcus sp. MV5 TaxID=1638272 RepID=UPI001439412D|nr:helix-turn-helix domain-containing protein [Thermococcus sp. MV5]NJE26475.1 helix-turn-helix domain-containing protein [Thermococcus sp. MV5]